MLTKLAIIFICLFLLFGVGRKKSAPNSNLTNILIIVLIGLVAVTLVTNLVK